MIGEDFNSAKILNEPNCILKLTFAKKESKNQKEKVKNGKRKFSLISKDSNEEVQNQQASSKKQKSSK